MKKTPRMIAFLLAVILVIGMTACTTPAIEAEEETGPETAVPETVEVEEEEIIEGRDAIDLAAEIAAKYAANDNCVYLPAIPPVARDHRFQFHLKFNPLDLGYEKTTELINVYADPNFDVELPSYMHVDPDFPEVDTIEISPYRHPALAIFNHIYTRGMKEERLTDIQDMIYFDDLGEFNDWGNMPRYYLVQWVDLETGEKLEKPIVQVFEVEAELPAPKAEFFVDEFGLASYRWEKVEGAERYIIIDTELYKEGETLPSFKNAGVKAVLDADTTEWHEESNVFYITGRNTIEDDYLPSWVELEEGQTIYPSNQYYYRHFGVIAIGNGGHSNVSRLFRDTDISQLLPWTVAYNTRKIDGTSGIYYDSIGQLPSQVPVLMCDGNIVYKTIKYDFERADARIEDWMTFDEGPNYEIENVEITQVFLLFITWKLPSTPFEGQCRVWDPPDTWETELKVIQGRQEAMMRGSGTGNTISLDTEKPSGDGEGGQGEDVKIPEVAANSKVFATNALSEYLAKSMIAGVPSIPLAPFTEASDTEHLLDAFFEAYYQNPLILGIDGLSLTSGNMLVVEYQDDKDTRKMKQEAIMEKVAKVIDEIIKDGMTPLEKEFAINQYLCDNAEYDFAALENAMENDYAYVDPSFNDSFTPFGILVNGVGVCAGYAGSFKLLADAAGLESIVVTGNLEGLVSHAWNRVYQDDEWVSVDVTNNSNPYFLNALLNLPDNEAAAVLVEDRDFILDRYLANYVGSNESNEYYRVEERYFETSEVVAELVAGLKNSDSVTLRTAYDIDDDIFNEIALAVIEELGEDDLYGGYWLGVISLWRE
ncbi:MAG: transglutaminase-like domain-containing protein [Clostridiales bacterium]|nr:transglutaminase-like domain-containing protein [Clostridiales bacterium]